MGVLSAYATRLTFAQRTLYDRLRSQGISDDIARQLAVAIEKSVQPVAKTTYHEAFADEARKHLPDDVVAACHVAARARSGGVASGAARRARRDQVGVPVDREVIKGGPGSGRHPGDGAREASDNAARTGEHTDHRLAAVMHASAASAAITRKDSFGVAYHQAMAAHHSREAERASLAKAGRPPLGAAFSHARATGKKQTKEARKKRAQKWLKDNGHPQMAKSEGLVPPKGVQAACRRGLELAPEYGGPGLTDGAKARARSMAAGHAVSPANIKRMASFFARHDSYTKESSPPSPGYVAWQLWGGNAGKSWASAKSAQLQKSVFNEEDHPRDDHGKFSDGGGSSDFHMKEADRLSDAANKAGKAGEFDRAKNLRNQARDHLRAASAAASVEHDQRMAAIRSQIDTHLATGAVSVPSGKPSVEPRGSDRHGKSFYRQDEDQHRAERDKSQAKADRYRSQGKISLADKHQASADAHTHELRAIANDKTAVSQDRLAGLQAEARAAFAQGGRAALESHAASLAPRERAVLAAVDSKVGRAERRQDRLTKALVTRVVKMSALPSEFVEPSFIGENKSPKRKRKKRSLPVDFRVSSRILKATAKPWQQLVYSVVYAPDVVDLHGDHMTADTIEKAAHDAMQNGIYVNDEHAGPALGAHVVESYIAPCDLVLASPDGAPTTVTKGTWVMGLKITDGDTWQRVLDGTYRGFSLEGTGTAELLAA